MCHQAQHPHHRTAVLIIMSFTAARRSIEPCDRSDRKKSSLIHFSVSSIFLNTAVVHHHPTFWEKEKERGHPAPRQGAKLPAPPLPNNSLDFALGHSNTVLAISSL